METKKIKTQPNKQDSYLPQSENEWMETNKFNIETVQVYENQIRCALTKGSEGTQLTTMVGGIPRDQKRRENLPLINKLYGHLALKMLSFNESSLMYNQPATGKSTGDWNKETLQTRAHTLANLSLHFYEKVKSSNLAIIGTSAGAYMAVKSLEELQKNNVKVSKLILLSPAAYPEDVEGVPYGEKFSEIIRKPWNVADSPIFQDLRNFVNGGGSVFISFFEDDHATIPTHIQEYYKKFAKELADSGGKIEITTIHGVAHNFRRIGVPENKNVVDNNSVRTTATNLSKFLSKIQ